ncbi:MAG: LysR family transcriptional regulator [Verrucomicrobiales bacterium]|jgi:DNA-binding transcriptional LysR family regulator|nr:LysR family transcriptional regulator [Verrucomicrobiales bacterium]
MPAPIVFFVMQIEFFGIFRDLAESQSFGKSAQPNNIDQRAISQQIHTIKDNVGMAGG